MPRTDFYRAIATIKVLQQELTHERDAHNAMKLCFEKIHRSLDMYRGHYINRLRFHLNRHHTEYLRKVRAMRKERGVGSEASHDDNEDGDRITAKSPPQRRSIRVGVAQELACEVEQLKQELRRKNLEIDRLAMLLDEADDHHHYHGTAADALQESRPGAGESRDGIAMDRKPPPYRNIRKLMNPYYPTDDEDDQNKEDDDDNNAAERVTLIAAARPDRDEDDDDDDA
jgi:hypothetical protein